MTGIEGGYPSDCELTQGLRQRAMARHQDDERGYVWRSCLAKAQPVVLFLLDVDGVLTDGTITYTKAGDESKSFHTRDGLGLRLVQKAGVEVGLITARTSEAVSRRAQDLGISLVFQGVGKKIAVLEKIMAERHLEKSQIAYMGDDWLDLPLLTRVGFAATVADGALEVKRLVDFVARQAGGRGAVREVCELIIEAKGQTANLLAPYLTAGG